MRKLFLFVAACLVACVTQTAKADDYTFDLRTLELGGEVVSPYTETTIPQDGVNVFVRITGVDQAPYIHAWKDGGDLLDSGFPGPQLTDVRYVSKKVNDNEKVKFYMYHFDNAALSTGKIGMVISLGNSSAQTNNIMIQAAGNYFFECNSYNMQGTTEVTEQYVTGGERIIPATGTNVFVREMNNDYNTYNNNAKIWLHAWDASGTNLRGDWPGRQMTDYIYIDGVKWFYWNTDNTTWGGIVFSQNGVNKTVDINNSETNKAFAAGDNFYTYKPFENYENAWRFAVENNKQYFQDRIPLKDRKANFKVWTYNEVALNNQIVMTDPENKFRLTFTLGDGKSVNDIQFDKTNGRLELPKFSTIKVESLSGYYLNEIILGPLTQNIAYGKDEVSFQCGPRESYLHDWFQTSMWSQEEYYHLANIFRNVLFDKTEIELGGNSSQSNLMYGNYFIGPKIYVRDERISTEDLTFSDHNVKQNKFLINEGLIGVDVFGEYLIARSENYISAHKHQPVAGQKILKVNGTTPAYADPATPQYSWIALKIDNPSEYIGAKLTNVRGMYCGSRDADSHRGWMNPTMDVEDFTVAEPKGSISTTLNTYSTANFSEQDKKNTSGYEPHYFYMEPRHWEICNVVDVMRTGDQRIYAPTENAILPSGLGNYYPRYGVEGSAGIDKPTQAWAKVDELYNGESWRTYNHVFNINHAIVLTQDWNQAGDTDHDYPLDTPNPYYEEESSQVYHLFLWGLPETEINIDEGYTDYDFATADMVYYSRYDVANNVNAYKNDLRIMISNPETDLSTVKDLIVTRRDINGNNPVKIADLRSVGDGKYRVDYVSATQTIENNVDGILDMGDTHYKTPSTEFNLSSNDPIIYLSDCFISNTLNNENDIAAQHQYYQYWVEKGENTTRDISCIVHGVPVFKAQNYSLTSAEYSEEDVINDIKNELDEPSKVDIAFTAVRPLAGCADTYDVWRGANATDMSESDISGNLEMENELSKNFSHIDAFNMEQNYYVPVQWTEYNDNTYGSYKRSVSDASIDIIGLEMMASTGEAYSDGRRYCNAKFTVNTGLDNNKDKRYLVRVWRKAGDVLTLLNGKTDLTGGDFATYNWETNWAQLALQGLNDVEEFNAASTTTLRVSDTFIAKPASASAPSGAPGLKAESEDFNMEEVTYFATIYVMDKATGNYYVKKVESEKLTSIPTAISTVNTGAQVESVRYYNTIGVESETPFQGLNIVVTRYSDGTTTTVKAVR